MFYLFRDRAHQEYLDQHPDACLYIKQLTEALFGLGPKSQRWAKEMRKQLQTKSDGVTRVFLSASALRRQYGLSGTAKSYDQAYAYRFMFTILLHHKLYIGFIKSFLFLNCYSLYHLRVLSEQAVDGS